MADRGEVKIRTGSINALISLYQETYKRMVQEIITASEAGKIQRARVMARINAELARLGVDVDAWVQKELPQYYLDGANAAIQDLRALGIDTTKRNQYAVVNREAIKALTDETALSFAQGLSAMGRNARILITDTFREQLNMIVAEGRLSGSTRKLISKNLEARIKEQGITSITDKAGRNWSFDRYTEMLARTKAVEARNQGLINRMLLQGYDLVQVTNHNSKHKACARWESKILSLTGRTPTGTILPGGYKVAGSLSDATLSGLFHPNCQHAINVLVPELAAKTKAYDNPYNNKARVAS